MCVWIFAGKDEVTQRLKAVEILLCLNEVLEINNTLLVWLIQTLAQNEASCGPSETKHVAKTHFAENSKGTAV